VSDATPLEPGRPRPPWMHRLWMVLATVVSIPIVVAAARGIRRDYLPIGDNALIEIRGRDVLTSHHPFLGTWSSASLSAGVDVNHPGPLLFDVVALPVRLFGGGPGIALGVAALHVAVVWAIGWIAHRIGGPVTAAVTMAFTGGLVWALGSEMLFDPWQPNVLVLPFLLLLVLVWGVVAGHHGMLPWAVVVGSFCVQTHLSYVFIAPFAVAVALAHVLVRWWRRREDESVREGLRWVVVAVGAGIVAWSQPLVEQFFGPGSGNLGRLATADSSGEGVRTGVSLGLRLVAAVVTLPPWWGRSGYVEAIPITQWTPTPDGQVMVVPGLAGLPLAVLSILVAAAAVGACWWWARRHHDHVVASAVVVIAAVTLVATLTVVITPIDRLGLSPHKLRWLWPIAVFLGLVLVLTVARAVERRRPADTSLLLGVAAVSVLFGAAAVPYHAQDAGPVAFRGDMPAVRSLVAQLDPLRDRGVVLFDAGGLRFAEPFTAPVMAGLQRRGIPFVLDEEGLVRQMGERRRFEGAADLVVFVREGAEALVVPPSAERVAFHPGLPPDERAELDALAAELSAAIGAGALDDALGGLDAGFDELAQLHADGVIDLVPALGDRTERYVDLQRRWIGGSVAVFAVPFDERTEEADS
jgi:hypothetical protein